MNGRSPGHPGRISVACFVAAGLLVAAEAHCDEAGRDVAVLSLAAAADLASTRYGLSVGLREGNPVMSEPAVSIAVKAATVAGTAYACGRLRRDGHPRAAKVLRWTVAGLWLGVAGWNVHRAGGAR